MTLDLALPLAVLFISLALAVGSLASMALSSDLGSEASPATIRELRSDTCRPEVYVPRSALDCSPASARQGQATLEVAARDGGLAPAASDGHGGLD